MIKAWKRNMSQFIFRNDKIMLKNKQNTCVKMFQM